MLGACSFDNCSAVRWNVCRPYGVRHAVRTSGLPVHPGYIQGRGEDLMYPLGRVPKPNLSPPWFLHPPVEGHMVPHRFQLSLSISSMQSPFSFLLLPLSLPLYLSPPSSSLVPPSLLLFYVIPIFQIPPLCWWGMFHRTGMTYSFLGIWTRAYPPPPHLFLFICSFRLPHISKISLLEFLYRSVHPYFFCGKHNPPLLSPSLLLVTMDCHHL